MTARLIPGPRTWSMSRDTEGHRTYKVKFLVECDKADGPGVAIRCPGLPYPGTRWIIDNEVDLWATCRWDADVTPLVTDGDPNTLFEIEFTFSTKPFDKKSCKDTELTDPLLEPQKISGSFVKYTEEATTDRLGFPITNSAHEQLRGPQVEFDSNRPQVRIEQNVAILNLALFSSMVDCVNSTPMWGLGARKIKLSNVTWEKKFQGTCQPYYTRTFEFEIRYDGFDRDLLDEGTKVLHGHWNNTTGNWDLDNIGGAAPSRNNPNHFDRFKDRQGENCRVILNGKGLPSDIRIGSEKVFASIVDGPNIGNALDDETAWRECGTSVTNWDSEAEVDYLPGDVVRRIIDLGFKTYNAGIYLCLTQTVDDPFSSPSWLKLIEDPPGLINAGEYRTDVRYVRGMYVKDSTRTTPGTIHVEKYPGADFLQLGIPLVF
jgi:hypothetical protein